MEVKGIVNETIELCSKVNRIFNSKKADLVLKYIHIHNWTYVDLKGTSVIQRTCDCGVIEERHPEIDARLGDGKELWLIRDEFKKIKIV